MGKYVNSNKPLSKRVKRVGLKRSRAKQDRSAQQLGRKLLKFKDTGAKVPALKAKRGPNLRVAERLIKTKAGKKKGGLALSSETKSTFDTRFREAWKGMDEAFSTAFTRNLVEGIVKEAQTTKLTTADFKHLVELVDIASTARMPTEFSGYATKSEKMQHPTGAGKGLFAKGYKNHGTMDTARRNYVDKAMQAEAKASKKMTEVITSGVKASIEFTLNEFTAPITAKNVFRYAERPNLSKKKFTDTDHRQLAERERMKNIYVKLGGTLRPQKGKETAAASLTREWKHDRSPFSLTGDIQREPPSPRRQPQLSKSIFDTYKV
ncbi:hypothetical protein [Halomonas llamarensis]|uniref:Uncharacterized protein n=1 Tax=Halomonas llamarensis TaxID=2945104 RepID=A0ABT0SL49_9GAMM|nr:hypothetical protein [Halomonas llamarensis]MCL7928527.1 hypothetical protein [Halomonas llamarensis]